MERHGGFSIGALQICDRERAQSELRSRFWEQASRLNLLAIRSKARLPAIYRDPARMLLRPLMRPFDVYLSRKRASVAIRHDVGLGAVVEYTVSELLDRSRYLYGSYEYVYASAFIGQITHGSFVVDVGANIGEYTVLAACATGKDGRVLAVEPNATLHSRLFRTLQINRISNVQVLAVALGSSEARGTLSVPSGASALATLRSTAETDEPGTPLSVSIRRLDDVLVKEDRDRVSLVKVDVEGWELEVFRGARETLATAKPVIFYECGAEEFEERGARRITPSMSFLEALGYRNHTIRMERDGSWELRPVEATRDPLREREPWSVLMIVAMHPASQHAAAMQGRSALPRCGLLEMVFHRRQDERPAAIDEH
jgi:FkbM family methyltransferase